MSLLSDIRSVKVLSAGVSTGIFQLTEMKLSIWKVVTFREYGLEVGQPIYGFFGYTSNGIVKNQAILDANPYLTNPENDFAIGLGDIWTVDIDGRDAEGKLTGKPDGKITADDRDFIGQKYPDFTYGLSGYLLIKDGHFRLLPMAHRELI